MRIASLGSGSRGNATLIENEDTCVLVDLGFSLKETVRRLHRLDRSPEDISAVLVTHEHADHIHGIGPFARKYKVPVYLTPGTHAQSRAGNLPAVKLVNCHRAFHVQSISIEPIPVPHDAKEPCQYILASGGRRVGVLTDLGHITPFVAERYEGCDALMLECNHDVQMLADGPYSWPLKQRVGGMHGHLNNGQAAAMLDGLDVARLQHLVVCHISEQNNHPDLAMAAVGDVMARSNAHTHIACQQEGFDWLEIN